MTLRSPRNEFVRKALLALAPAVLLLATAGSASAATKFDSIMQDDRLFGNPATQAESLDTADGLGVDVIHTIVGWRGLAPSADAKKKPRGFNAADPGDYNAEDWDRFDDLVRGAKARGIQVLMSPAGPIPDWATECRKPGTFNVCSPKASEYQLFMTAVAKRYSGRYKDENQGNGTLPKVDRLSVWNEPNLRSWIDPTKNAAAKYRELIYAGEKGISKGKYRGKLYIGETAPLNNSLKFWRELFCIDTRGKVLTGKNAKKVGCTGRKIKRFKAVGISHHPYTRGGTPPFKKAPKSTDMTLYETQSRLVKVLDQGAKVGAVRRNIPIYFTEFGVSTDPPDTKFGVPFAQQAEAINRAELIAYDQKRVFGFTQFQLSDDTGTGQEEGAIQTFQTGLRTRANEEKPSFSAYRTPLYVVKSGSGSRVWGGARPGAGKQVEIQTGSNGNFTTVKTVSVDRYGYIDEKIDASSGDVRLKWAGPTGDILSRVASVEAAKTIAIPKR
jgi:hypothetical protein